jgi:hypothetical protein
MSGCTVDLVNSATFTGTFTHSGNTSDCKTKIANGLRMANMANPGATVLDWYEEGTFIPGIALGGVTTGITYSAQIGRFTRIGNTVFFNLSFTLTSKGASAGSLIVTGLPYTTQNSGNFPCSVFATSVAAGVLDYGLFARVVANSTTLRIDKATAAGSVVQLTDSDILNGTLISLSGNYGVQ